MYIMLATRLYITNILKIERLIAMRLYISDGQTNSEGFQGHMQTELNNVGINSQQRRLRVTCMSVALSSTRFIVASRESKSNSRNCYPRRQRQV